MTKANKAGLVLAGFLGLLDISQLAAINTEFPGDFTEPPGWLVILGAALGLITLAALVPAWRGRRQAVLVVVVSRVLSALAGIPGYFVNVPSYILVTTTIYCLLTILAVWLSLRGGSHSSS